MWNLGAGTRTAHVIDDAGACVATATPPAETYVQGAALDLSTLPNLETLVVGSVALRALFSGFGGMPYLPVASLPLRDASGGACLPYQFPDESLRCVPTAFTHASRNAFVYEDASCTDAPILPWLVSGACPTSTRPPLPHGVVISEHTDCLNYFSLSEVIAVVGESSASTFYVKDSETGACHSAEPSAQPYTYLRLGEALEASEFAELERATRW